VGNALGSDRSAKGSRPPSRSHGAEQPSDARNPVRGALLGWVRFQVSGSPGGLRWDGGVFPGRVPASRANAYGGAWSLNRAGARIERYLLGVVPHELAPARQRRPLAAQRWGLARTWALRNTATASPPMVPHSALTLSARSCDPRQAGAAVRGPFRPPRARYSAFGSKPINAVYTPQLAALRLGVPKEVLERSEARPYLQARPGWAERLCPTLFAVPAATRPCCPDCLRPGRAGAYGADHPRFRLATKLTGAQIGQDLSSQRRAQALAPPCG